MSPDNARRKEAKPLVPRLIEFLQNNDPDATFLVSIDKNRYYFEIYPGVEGGRGKDYETFTRRNYLDALGWVENQLRTAGGRGPQPVIEIEDGTSWMRNQVRERLHHYVPSTTYHSLIPVMTTIADMKSQLWRRFGTELPLKPSS